MIDANSPSRPPRDWVDFAYKVVTGIVLVAIPIVIKVGADSIATSLETGRLVQSLITDLTTRDQHTRQDIALIALDNAVGDKYPNMVVQIAAQVLFSRPSAETPADLDPKDTVAFRIITKRAGEQEAEQVLQTLGRLNPVRAEQVAADLLAQDPTKSPPEAASPAPEAAPTIAQEVPEQARRIARAFKGIIYVQFHDAADRPVVERLQKALRDQGLLVPGIEHVQADYRNAVRYFHVEDRTRAAVLRDKALSFFQSEGRAIDFPEPQGMSNLKAPVGQIEIWIRNVG